MKVTHHEETRGGRLLDVLTDEEHGFRIIVSRLGAELISVARRKEDGTWVGFLHRDNDIAAPAKGWANHATVMGYFLHRLKDEHSLYRGQEIKGGTHSFLRHKLFTDVEINIEAEPSLTYRISPEDFTATEYPLQVSLALTYTLCASTLKVAFTFTNQEPELVAHVGFGLHPGFASASPESFRFTMPAGTYRRYFAPNNYISGETEDIHCAGGEMPFAKAKLPGSYIVDLSGVPERKFTFEDDASGRRVHFDMQEVPYLTLWSDGGSFLCVEPCWGLTDFHEQRAFEDKEGIQKIPPGETLTRSFHLSPQIVA